MDADQFKQLLTVFQESQKQLIQQLVPQSQAILNPVSTPASVNYQVPPFENYDSSKEKFKSYLLRFENYVERTNIPANSKQSAALLLHSIGATHFNTLSALVAPKELTKFEYSELVTAFSEVLAPKRNVVVSQHYFLSTFQKENQSISDYVALLQRDMAECDFNTKCECGKLVSVAEIFLRAQFIRGIRDSTIREKLLQYDAPSFQEVLKKAVALEAVRIECNELSKQSPISEITASNSNEARLGAPVDTNKISKFPNTNKKFQGKPFQRRSRSKFRNRLQQHNLQKNKSGDRRPFKKVDYRTLGIENLCLRCGRDNHIASECRSQNLSCTSCKKPGHTAKVCITTLIQRNKEQNSTSQTANQIVQMNDDATSSFYRIVDVYDQLHTPENDTEKYYATVFLESRPFQFEVDSGAGLTLIPEDQYAKLGIANPVQPCSQMFRDYSGLIFRPKACVNVRVQYRDTVLNEVMYIVPSGRAPLLGRQWIRRLNIRLEELDKDNMDTVSINLVQGPVEIIRKYSKIFERTVGAVPNIEIKLQLREGAKPVFIRERDVPYALRDEVENELKRLESAGIITKVQQSDWGSPLVVIPKADNTVRLCVDYKVGVNQKLVNSNYPIRRIEEVLNTLRDSKYFCKLDLYKAYLHLKVDPESANIQTISTHRGTYRMNRLSFGIKTAPSEFNRVIDQVIDGLPKTIAYFDDIMVHGHTRMECENNLRACLDRLQKFDLHLNPDKCEFFKTRIEYLGHVVEHNKISKSPAKVKAIVEMPRPKNKDEVRRFLGLITYYSRFLPNNSTLTYPLRQLLRNSSKFIWTRQCESAFLKLKNEIVCGRVLVPYDPALPLVLTTDASPVGVAAILSHCIEGQEKPIAYASRSLTSAEMNYSQVDREALAIVFGANHFFQYLFGREFLLQTDNSALTRIFHPSSKLPPMTAGRLLRYAVFLNGFDYKIKFKKGIDNQNVDCLSRAPVPATSDTYDILLNKEVHELNLVSVAAISTLLLTPDNIAKETSADPELLALKEKLQSTLAESDYTLDSGIIFKGSRVVMPTTLRSEALKELHSSHIGTTKMKQLARRYIYWHGIDRDIEQLVRSCSSCALHKHDPPKVHIHSWDPPSQNWERIHMDYAGPVDGWYFLIVVDAKSRWLEVKATQQAPTTQSTLAMLNEIFATHGFPVVLVSDNASIFKSGMFQEYCKLNGIFPKYIAPGHPATNGLAERNVQTFKNRLKTSKGENENVPELVRQILFKYRATPLACGKTPAELYFGRSFRSRLDAIKPIHLQPNTSSAPPVRTLLVGERVQARIYQQHVLWKFGTVQRKLGRVHYIIEFDDGTVLKRHINQLRSSGIQNKTVTFAPTEPHRLGIPVTPEEPGQTNQPTVAPENPVAVPIEGLPPPQPRYPTRERHPPSRFRDYYL